MTRQALAALITLSVALVLWPVATAQAETEMLQCRELLAPAAVAQRDIGIDQARAACAADSFGAGARSLLSADGRVGVDAQSASLFLDYRVLHLSGFEFGLGARVADYRFAPAGSGGSGELAAGPLHLDVLRPKKSQWFGRPVVVSHALRVAIPYTTSSQSDFSLALSPSIMASVSISEDTELHGRVAGLLRSTIPDGSVDSSAALLAGLDIAHAPLSFAALVVGAEVQGGWYGAGLDHLQGRAGLRVAAGQGAAIELSAAAAVLGSEAADLIAWVGYRRSAALTKAPERSRLQDWAK